MIMILWDFAVGRKKNFLIFWGKNLFDLTEFFFLPPEVRKIIPRPVFMKNEVHHLTMNFVSYHGSKIFPLSNNHYL